MAKKALPVGYQQGHEFRPGGRFSWLFPYCYSLHLHDVIRLPRLIVELGAAAVEADAHEEGAAL